MGANTVKQTRSLRHVGEAASRLGRQAFPSANIRESAILFVELCGMFGEQPFQLQAQTIPTAVSNEQELTWPSTDQPPQDDNRDTSVSYGGLWS